MNKRDIVTTLRNNGSLPQDDVTDETHDVIMDMVEGGIIRIDDNEWYQVINHDRLNELYNEVWS